MKTLEFPSAADFVGALSLVAPQAAVLASAYASLSAWRRMDAELPLDAPHLLFWLSMSVAFWVVAHTGDGRRR